VGDDELLLHPDWEKAIGDVLDGRAEVNVVYQPIVDLRRGTVCGYEALSRFPADMAAGPDKWFAAAALHGRGVELEAVTLEVALAGRATLGQNCFLSLNVSPEAVCSERIQALLLNETDLRGVVLEITEQTPVEDYTLLQEALAPLREAGATVAVDDAGAGYASMRHVVALEPQFVKLDRSLVSNAHADPRKAAAISAIGAFAGELDAWVVAEGIETSAELDALVSMQLPLAQGYLLGRPSATMDHLGDDLGRRIRDRVQRSGIGVGALVQPALTIGADEDARQALGENVPPDVAVRVDEYERPLSVVVARQGAVEESPALCTDPETPPEELALRAMARPSGRRFVPAACCDERGRLLGLVRVERLVEALARR
jgi:EAL domain-containing protein (putative c-di-GMP-specific phosphodiesterase class I)